VLNASCYIYIYQETFTEDFFFKLSAFFLVQLQDTDIMPMHFTDMLMTGDVLKINKTSVKLLNECQ